MVGGRGGVVGGLGDEDVGRNAGVGGFARMGGFQPFAASYLNGRDAGQVGIGVAPSLFFACDHLMPISAILLSRGGSHGKCEFGGEFENPHALVHVGLLSLLVPVNVLLQAPRAYGRSELRNWPKASPSSP